MTEKTITDDEETLVLTKATIDTTYRLLKPIRDDPMLRQYVADTHDALINAAAEVPAHNGRASVTLTHEQWTLLYGFAGHYDGDIEAVSTDDAQRVVSAFEEKFSHDLMERVETTTAFHESLMEGPR